MLIERWSCRGQNENEKITKLMELLSLRHGQHWQPQPPVQPRQSSIAMSSAAAAPLSRLLRLSRRMHYWPFIVLLQMVYCVSTALATSDINGECRDKKERKGEEKSVL